MFDLIIKWCVFLDFGECKDKVGFLFKVFIEMLKVFFWIEVFWKRVKGCCVVDFCIVLVVFRVKVLEIFIWYFDGFGILGYLFRMLEIFFCCCFDRVL